MQKLGTLKANHEQNTLIIILFDTKIKKKPVKPCNQEIKDNYTKL